MSIRVSVAHSRPHSRPRPRPCSPFRTAAALDGVVHRGAERAAVCAELRVKHDVLELRREACEDVGRGRAVWCWEGPEEGEEWVRGRVA